MPCKGPLVFLFLLLCVAPASAQISPGKLARPHAELEGSLNCNKCHTGRAETMPSRCLGCHTEIAALQKEGRGLHGRLKNRPCMDCHPDHAGREFDLISWEEGAAEKFDHARSGWPLLGMHAKTACRECHRAEFQKSAITPKIRHRPAGKSWLGLETKCVTCHKDPHAGTLGTACESCHGIEGWKPATGFDHARTSYPLTGKHAQVACAKCHGKPASETTRAAVDPKRLKPVAHTECSACHADPHKGSLGVACSSCHMTSSFKSLNAKSFRHDKTRFPLLGAHAAVACEKCHTKPGGGALPKPPFAACLDCHAQVHGTQLAGRADKGACESCHTVNGWRPSTYTAAQHASLRLPLEGAHEKTECRACHVVAKTATQELGSAKVQLAWTEVACERCHVDPHKGRWATATGGCRSCHDLNSFHRAGVDVAAHDKFSYPLKGAHRALPCVACHAELGHDPARSTLVSGPVGVPALPFDQKRSACRDCHRNPHGASFEDPGAKDCAGCHDEQTFVPATRFNHDRDSRFPLKGAHAKVACRSCHPIATGSDGKTFVMYRPLDTACRSCHAGSTMKASLDSKARGSRSGGDQ